MKKVQRMLQKRILPRKSSTGHQNLSNNSVDLPNNEINKRKVLQRYKNAWYAEINNQYESSDSSGSEIDDETGYIRMKRNTKLQHLRQNSMNYSNILEYSTGENSTVDDDLKLGQSMQYIQPERDKDGRDVTSAYFMRASFDFLSYDITDASKEVTIYEGEVVKVTDTSDKKKYLIETVNGSKVHIPKCYLADITKEELYDILYDNGERKENGGFTSNDASSTNEITSNDPNPDTQKYSKTSDTKDKINEKQIDSTNRTTATKKSRKSSFSEFVNKKFSSLTKYTSLTDNLDKDEVLEREDQDKMFQYKINPVTQRKTKPKKPLVFDHKYEIWVDGDHTPDGVEHTSDGVSSHVNAQDDNTILCENNFQNESTKFKDLKSSIEKLNTEFQTTDDVAATNVHTSIEKLTMDDKLITQISSSASTPKPDKSSVGNLELDNSLILPNNISSCEKMTPMTSCSNPVKHFIIESHDQNSFHEHVTSISDVKSDITTNEKIEEDLLEELASITKDIRDQTSEERTIDEIHNISSENEDLMNELSNQQELLMQQIEELNNFTFDDSRC